MSAVPLLRPALPGARSGGARIPRLGLAIPPSPNVKPVGTSAAGGRPALPVLHLATPMGSTITPQEHPLRPSAQGMSASGGSESSAAHSRSGSFGPLDGRASIPTSAGSQYSALSFASQYGIGSNGLGSTRNHGTPDPVSAVGSLYSNASEGQGGTDMERDGSLHGLENFDKLSLERARTLDVEELDDEGWRIASLEKRIVELGALGEGAGGAVTRCKLKGGKTVFALKVWRIVVFSGTHSPFPLTFPPDYHNKPRPRCKEANIPRAGLQQKLRVRTHLQVLRCFPRPLNCHHFHRNGVLRRWIP